MGSKTKVFFCKSTGGKKENNCEQCGFPFLFWVPPLPLNFPLVNKREEKKPMTCDTLHPSVRVAETRYPSSRLIFGFRANGEFPLLLFSSSLRLNTRRLSLLFPLSDTPTSITVWCSRRRWWTSMTATEPREGGSRQLWTTGGGSRTRSRWHFDLFA